MLVWHAMAPRRQAVVAKSPMYPSPQQPPVRMLSFILHTGMRLRVVLAIIRRDPRTPCG